MQKFNSLGFTGSRNDDVSKGLGMQSVFYQPKAEFIIYM